VLSAAAAGHLSRQEDPSRPLRHRHPKPVRQSIKGVESASPGLWPGSMDLGLFVGAPSTVLRQSRDQPWYAGMVDRNVADRPRCPCSPTVRQQDRQTAPAATRRAIGSPRPPAAKGPSLWPSTLERSFWCCALAVQAHSASVTPAGSRAFLRGSVAGCDLARTPRDAHRPRRPGRCALPARSGLRPRGMKALRGRSALRCRCCPGRPRPGLRPDAPVMVAA
jgi:hypothetical protein